MLKQKKCSLCESLSVVILYVSQNKFFNKIYYHCEECDLVFLPTTFHLNLTEQKERYLEHSNDINNLDYRKFLSRLWSYLRPSLFKGAKGLDYGSGPGPALAIMIAEAGYDVLIYDPIFSPHHDLLKQKYDFITCTETVEHFSNPKIEFQTLNRMLNSKGILGIMTSMLDNWKDFPDWYYHRDPTHIAFYSKNTMKWIAKYFSLKIEFPRENVVFFRKN